MIIACIIFTLFCCCITAFLVEKHIVSVLKKRDMQTLELFDELGNYIYENRKQIQENINVTNQLTNKLFYNK